jgi:8-oxo-dGTP diphosphatase
MSEVKVVDGAKIFIANQALGKYLFVLRDNKADIPHPNKWSLIGGGLEPGETPLEAITREIAEEVDIPVSEIKFICEKAFTSELQGKLFPITGHFFIGSTSIEDLSTVVLNEGQKLQYFTLDEILNLPNVTPNVKELITNHRQILDHALSRN